jgi:hypothetical protein
MRFALVDMDGTTVDRFDDEAFAREEIRTLLERDPEASDELMVLEYRGDERVGPPLAPADFLAREEPGRVGLVFVSTLANPVLEVMFGDVGDAEGHGVIEIESPQAESEHWTSVRTFLANDLVLRTWTHYRALAHVNMGGASVQRNEDEELSVILLDQRRPVLK